MTGLRESQASTPSEEEEKEAIRQLCQQAFDNLDQKNRGFIPKEVKNVNLHKKGANNWNFDSNVKGKGNGSC